MTTYRVLPLLTTDVCTRWMAWFQSIPDIFHKRGLFSVTHMVIQQGASLFVTTSQLHTENIFESKMVNWISYLCHYVLDSLFSTLCVDEWVYLCHNTECQNFHRNWRSHVNNLNTTVHIVGTFYLCGNLLLMEHTFFSTPFCSSQCSVIRKKQMSTEVHHAQPVHSHH